MVDGARQELGELDRVVGLRRARGHRLAVGLGLAPLHLGARGQIGVEQEGHLALREPIQIRAAHDAHAVGAHQLGVDERLSPEGARMHLDGEHVAGRAQQARPHRHVHPLRFEAVHLGRQRARGRARIEPAPRDLHAVEVRRKPVRVANSQGGGGQLRQLGPDGERGPQVHRARATRAAPVGGHRRLAIGPAMIVEVDLGPLRRRRRARQTRQVTRPDVHILRRRVQTPPRCPAKGGRARNRTAAFPSIMNDFGRFTRPDQARSPLLPPSLCRFPPKRAPAPKCSDRTAARRRSAARISFAAR